MYQKMGTYKSVANITYGLINVFFAFHVKCTVLASCHCVQLFGVSATTFVSNLLRAGSASSTRAGTSANARQQ